MLRHSHIGCNYFVCCTNWRHCICIINVKVHKLGKDENLRRKVIAKLDESRRTSPIWNARQFTKNVESSYRQMWQIYCES